MVDVADDGVDTFFVFMHRGGGVGKFAIYF